ncbi:hypothetical protein FACS1894211_05950 [Clostridia bacterium]|nr:hypothetical protein FACS1894211_05950 [Clostridia bacterium]
MKRFSETALYEFNREINPAQIAFMRAEDPRPHFHHQMEILYVAEGTVTVAVNGEEAVLGPGGLCVSDSYDAHAYAHGEGAKSYVIIVPKSYVAEYGALTRNKILAGHFCQSAEAAAALEPLFALLSESFDGRGGRGELYRKGLVAGVLGVILEYFPYQKSAQADKLQGIRDILSYIHGHLDGEIGLKALAKRFGYTPTHFSHLFNASTGFHLREFVNTLRAQRAAARLKAGDPVLSVALDCGFSNVRTFYRAFTALYGVTPRKYSVAAQNKA